MYVDYDKILTAIAVLNVFVAIIMDFKNLKQDVYDKGE